MITLDATVIMSHFRPVGEHHVEAGHLLADRAAGGFLIHRLNLAEVLVGAVRIGRAAEMLADLREMGVEVRDPTPDEPLELATLRARSGLKLPDCCALHTAIAGGRREPPSTARSRQSRDHGLEVLPS